MKEEDEDVEYRIVDGDLVEYGEFPWMGALGYSTSGGGLEGRFRCGGTLISDTFVLTAAHCVRYQSPQRRPPTVVRFGLDPRGESGFLTYHIKTIFRHSNYNVLHKRNDIGLLELKERVYFSNEFKPACLYVDKEDLAPNIDLTVIGWGVVSLESRNTSDVLLKANLKTMPWAQCNSTLFEHNRGINSRALRDGLIDGQYCAYDPNGVKDSCIGDDGGPLQLIGNDTIMAKIVAIVSFSSGECGTSSRTSLPSVYTRVASYIDWIESIVWPNDTIIPPLIRYVDQ